MGFHLYLYFYFWRVSLYNLGCLGTQYRPDWPQTQQSTCLCLQSAGIKSVHHHCLAYFTFIKHHFPMYPICCLYPEAVLCPCSLEQYLCPLSLASFLFSLIFSLPCLSLILCPLSQRNFFCAENLVLGVWS